MSSTLHWRPVNHDGEYLGDEIKFILREHLGGGIISDWRELGQSDISFLEGVAAASKGTVHENRLREVRELIDLIQKHGSIEVREVY